MKQKEQPLSDAQKSLKKLQEMPIHPEYVHIPEIPIPYQNGVLIKELNPTDKKIGSILIPNNSDNTLKTNEAIIYAVGPGCADYVKIGTKCQYAAETKQAPYPRYYVGTHEFIAVEFYSLLYAIPDPTTVVYNGTVTDKVMGRKKRQERQKHVLKEERKEAAYEKDIAGDKTKGKTRKMK